MVSLKISKTLKKAWEFLKSCSTKNTEEKIITTEIKNILKELDIFKEQYDFLKEILKGDFREIAFIAMMIYPEKSLKEAIKSLYSDLKVIVNKYEMNPEEINKYFKINVSEVENNYLKTSAISKVAFIKKIIENEKNKNCIFDI